MKVLSFLFCLTAITTFSQLTPEEEIQLAEYKSIVNSNVHDSIRVNALINWDNLVYWMDQQQDSILLEQIITISRENLKKKLNLKEKLFFAKELADGLNYLGTSITENGGYFEESVPLYEEAISIYKQAKIDDGLDGCYINLGVTTYDLGDIQQAIIYYNKGLKLTDKTGNLRYRANGFMSLGIVYLDIKEYEKSIEYLYKALAIDKETEAIGNMEVTYLNLGNAYLISEQLDSALICYKLAYKKRDERQDLHTLGTTMNNLGEIYLTMGEMDSSIYYYTEGMKIRTELDDQRDLIYSYGGICSWYTENGHPKKGIPWGEKGLNLAKSFNNHVHMVAAAGPLYLAYQGAGDFEKGLEVYILRQNSLDSIQSESNQKELISQEVQYAYEKNKLADSLAFEKQKAIDNLAHEKDMAQEAKERYVLYGGLAFVLILGGLAFLGYQRKKKANHIISKQKEQAEHQKELIEEAHKEITDSIAYAKRIQSAILPPDKLVQELLPESFVLYKPKDVVAGDFYWLEKVENNILFAAADCTGHGVPGAMVSVICNGALNRSVREFGLTDPAKILDKAREIVIQEFEKSEEEVKDGMDIALCSINDMTLTYAGANNPLWIVRNNEIIETKADKQPIGKFSAAKAFTSHSIELQKGDTIYIFSDGYVDQFGGDKGKKLKAKALRELLLSIQDSTLKEQESILDQSFESWRGDLEQIDDVCVIGVRLH